MCGDEKAVGSWRKWLLAALLPEMKVHPNRSGARETETKR